MGHAITIAIPTYHRVEKLLDRLSELMPQMSFEDKILISDNATPGFDPSKYGEFQDPRVRILINKSNIGSCANVVKCFEYCDTDWMWLLSDDDKVLSNALDNIRHEIDSNPLACYINYVSRGIGKPRSETVVIDNLGDFISRNDGFSNTLLLSNNVYNLPRILEYMKFAYAAIWTNAPHLAPVLKALEQRKLAVYSMREVVIWNMPDLQETWSLTAAYNLVNLSTILENSEYVYRLRKVIIGGLPRPEYFVLQLCYMSLKYGNSLQIREYARQILQCYKLSWSLFRWIRFGLLSISVNYPRFTLFLGSVLYKKLKQKNINKALQDRKFHFYL